MKGFVLSIFVFSAVIMAAEANKCYVCTGYGDVCAKDKLEADKANKLMTCPSGMDRCMAVWLENGDVTGIAKSCANKATCDATKKACDDVTVQCAVSCCDTDECNAGSAGLPTDAIKCYVCTGTGDVCAKDKLEADKAKYLVSCPSGLDRCMRTWAKKDDVTAMTKSCASKATCDATKKACDDVTDGQCAVSCCETDECNAGSAGLPTDGIKCYVCAGTENTCAKDKLEADKARYLKTCPSSMDRCLTTWAKQDGKTALTNSCASKSTCDTVKKVCDNYKDGQCTVSCCDTDECNAGSAGLPNGIKCYHCLGTKDACAKDKLERDKAKYVKTCPRSLDRCMLYWTIKDNQAVALSTCADKTLCDATKQACSNSSAADCAVRCCETDECNAVSPVASHSSSVFLMSFCSVLGLALINQA
ncbi:uncharacterized protein LOC144654863 isoform X1 [Oculina patagonica]